jgi:chorismate dehydratase
VQDRPLPRIGCVRFLNALPLIHGWDGVVDFDDPSTLCRKLAMGRLPAALVSSFEFLRNPIYRIVDNVAISSNGPVYSVVVAHAAELEAITEIELDPASETSVNLLRCLLAKQHLTPRLVNRRRGEKGAHTAQLFIGDNAIRFRRSNPRLRYWDLGEEWKKLANRPFVYALWLVRPEFEVLGLASQLRSVRDRNLQNIESVIAAQQAVESSFCRSYYRDNLGFFFAEPEKEGLLRFANLCLELNLIPKAPAALNLV